MGLFEAKVEFGFGTRVFDDIGTAVITPTERNIGIRRGV